MDTEEIILKIMEKSKLSREEIDKRIGAKQSELAGLVSKDGAAYIIAREIGLDLFNKVKRRLQIKNVIGGIRNLDLTARVHKMFQPLEFEREGKKSSVANVILSDGSGVIRLSLWDDQIKLLEKLKVGMVVDIYGAYTKDDGRGGVEVRLSKRGGFKESTMQLPALDKTEMKFERCDISNLKENGNYELRAMVAQLFESGAFYEVCPECGSRIKRTAKGFECQKHGIVNPSFSIVISGVIDDGTGNIRAVMFKDAALKLIGMDLNKALDHMDDLFQNIDALGKEFIFTGRVRKNQMFNRTEFIISDLKDVDVKNEINEQMKALTKA